MEIVEFKNKFQKYLNELDMELDSSQIEQFYKYMNILIEWNEKINLTAIIEPEEIILKHFVDSLTIAKYIPKGARIIDIGTGAGFPGIPLKIVKKDIKVTLLDSLKKRVNFLNNVIEKLELSQIETIHGRAEEYGNNKEYRERFDIATSRAVANLSSLSEYLMPFVKKEGLCICMKGPEIEEELEKARKAILVLGGNIEKQEKFNLPNTIIGRNVIIIKKIHNTPNKYPRKPGIPAKDPIK